jgi:hypothetical protein
MHWASHVLSNTRGILTVFDLVRLRRTRGGIIDITHPFATGLGPPTGRRVWRENLLYRSRAAEIPLEDDVAIVERVMNFMRGRAEQLFVVWIEGALGLRHLQGTARRNMERTLHAAALGEPVGGGPGPRDAEGLELADRAGARAGGLRDGTPAGAAPSGDRRALARTAGQTGAAG